MNIDNKEKKNSDNSDKSDYSASDGEVKESHHTDGKQAKFKGSLKLAISSKTLKRCLSVPIIKNLPSGPATRASVKTGCAAVEKLSSTAAKLHNTTSEIVASHQPFNHNHHIGMNRSNPSSREVSPAPTFNIFAPRARRYSAGNSNGSGASTTTAPLCLTPRVSQLRKEECLDANSREMNHEREVHNAMQMSQSWEDLTLVTENWSCKSDEFSNPLQVVLPCSGLSSCSSPSPTSTRAGMRLPYGLSPSPTRRTFATRRSMSPIAMRPSQLCAVKRKFEMDECNATSNWNVCSPPPLKKIFTESRGSSPSSVCPSPDSGNYDGRSTPKLFLSKLCTTNANTISGHIHNSNSACSSPLSGSSPLGSCVSGAISDVSVSALCSTSSSSASCASEPMSICTNTDEGISVSEGDEKVQVTSMSEQQDPIMPTDMQDESTLMDDLKSETSSIGGCSTVSTESASCDSGNRSSSSFLSRLHTEDVSNLATAVAPNQRQFFINKLIGGSGVRKYIVNHDTTPTVNMPESSLDFPSNAKAEKSSI